MLTSAARRRVFGEYQSTEPSRFLDEIPAELVERIAPGAMPRYQSAFSHSHYEFRTNPYGRKGRRRAREAEASYAYENEDQSAIGVRTGMRVRHAQFGVGTVIAVEEHNDDLKITVRFASVGVKKLLSNYAKLGAGVKLVARPSGLRSSKRDCQSHLIQPERSVLLFGPGRRSSSEAGLDAGRTPRVLFALPLGQPGD